MSFRQQEHVMDLPDALETQLASSHTTAADLLSGLVAEHTQSLAAKAP